jgi:hypothetical protein
MEKEYRELLSILIKSQIRLVGKVAITIANELPGLEVSESGEIKKATNAKNLFFQLYQEYRKYGFGIVTAFIKPQIKNLLKKYPNLEIPAELRE